LLGKELPEPYVVVTVFSKSNFAPNLAKGTDRHDISRIRLAEDQSCCHRIGARHIALGFPEAPLRGYPNLESIYTPHLEPLTEPIYSLLETTMHELMLRLGGVALMVAPLGIGDHVDHLLVAAVAIRLSFQTSIPLLLYEDLPYAYQVSLALQEWIWSRFGMPLIPKLVKIDATLQEKIELIELYTSQVVPLFFQAVKEHARHLGKDWDGFAERAWLMNPYPWRAW
jgi:LmbE family N-acetylglucosaminyl deacetylase